MEGEAFNFLGGRVVNKNSWNRGVPPFPALTRENLSIFQQKIQASLRALNNFCKADGLVKNVGQIFIKIQCSICKSNTCGEENL